jgi:hypothetical protein
MKKHDYCNAAFLLLRSELVAAAAFIMMAAMATETLSLQLRRSGGFRDQQIRCEVQSHLCGVA